MLDEFSTTNIKDKPQGTFTKSTPNSPKPVKIDTPRSEDEELEKNLQAGMAELLSQFESDDGMKSQFESLMKELAEADHDQSSIKSNDTKSTNGDTKTAFQDTIRKTMERMQNSGDSATAAATSSSNEDDILAQMLKEMEKNGMGGESGGEEDFNGMLMGMMEQLTNKDILYEPMKDLNDKYPAWIEKNGQSVSKDDLKRYQEQQVLVKEIVARFERQGYTDENQQDRDYIVERMQKVCQIQLD